MAASIRVGSACVRNFLRADVRMVKQQIRQRWKWRHSGKSPEEAKTYDQRVAEMTRDTSKAVNIGFRLPKQKDFKLAEKESDDTESEVLDPIDDESMLSTINDHWYSASWSKDMLSVAQHYGLYRDLFGRAFFYPQFPLNVFFDYDSESVTPVYNGNILSPSEVEGNPQVEYDFVPDTLYTLALTAPDSHLQQNTAEYLHWLVGNIPGDDISKGEELCSYLPPFPVRGTGFHRYVFVLYKQEKKIDFHQDKRPDNCMSLKQRTFRTADFYRRMEDDITPVSLSFFQSEWDESVTKTFWHKLDMKEPSFEFMHPPPYHPKQVKFPQGKPFNLYLDRYRDVKDINEEILKEKLKGSPFSPPPPRPKYVNIYWEPHGPTWLRLKNKHKRQREMHWEDLN